MNKFCFTDKEKEELSSVIEKNYFHKFQELNYVASFGAFKGKNIKGSIKGKSHPADLRDIDDILTLYMNRERALGGTPEEADVKMAVTRIYMYGAYFITRDEDGVLDCVVPIIPTGTRKKCMACHFVDPCAMHNNYGSYVKVIGIMHSIEWELVKDLGVETSMLVVSAKQSDKLLNRLIAEVVGDNFIFAGSYKMYPFNTTVNWDKLRSFRSKRQQKKYMNQVSASFEKALHGVFTRWAFVGDDELVRLDEIIREEDVTDDVE